MLSPFCGSACASPASTRWPRHCGTPPRISPSPATSLRPTGTSFSAPFPTARLFALLCSHTLSPAPSHLQPRHRDPSTLPPGLSSSPLPPPHPKGGPAAGSARRSPLRPAGGSRSPARGGGAGPGGAGAAGRAAPSRLEGEAGAGIPSHAYSCRGYCGRDVAPPGRRLLDPGSRRCNAEPFPARPESRLGAVSLGVPLGLRSCGVERDGGAPAAGGRAGTLLGDPRPLHPEPGSAPLFPSGGSRAPGTVCRAARRGKARKEPRKLPVRFLVCKTLRCRSAGREPRLCSALNRAELPALRPSAARGTDAGGTGGIPPPAPPPHPSVGAVPQPSAWARLRAGAPGSRS